MYDIAIVGAGVNGCSLAFEFAQKKQTVLLLDGGDIASGGSGAAGAFISPKFSKYGELKELIQDSFLYSLDFYEKDFPQFMTKTPLIHIAKDEKDEETLRFYKKNSNLKLDDINNFNNKESVSLDTAIINAKSMCEALCDGAEFVKREIKL